MIQLHPLQLLLNNQRMFVHVDMRLLNFDTRPEYIDIVTLVHLCFYSIKLRIQLALALVFEKFHFAAVFLLEAKFCVLLDCFKFHFSHFELSLSCLEVLLEDLLF